MDKIKVTGPCKISGTVEISGAKNSALPIIFSTLICPGVHKIKNVPDLVDVNYALKILSELGARVDFDKEKKEVFIDQPKVIKTSADYDLVRKMRASILVLGPLLSRFGQTKVSLPGGCAIGTRPIDQHIEAVEALGAEVEVLKGLTGSEVFFKQPTVGGTENALMASILAKGTTVLKNAAQEPEITDLADCLNSMGANIKGQGTSEITIQGVKDLKPLNNYSVIGDRIEAGTFAVAAAITRSDLKIKNCNPKLLSAFLKALSSMGVPVEEKKDSAEGKERTYFEVLGSQVKVLKAIQVRTSPHPGFPTDLQAQIMTLMTQAEGVSLVEETIFENRFMHAQELARLGANIKTQTRIAQIYGPAALVGAPVMATDLRASASLILAGLCAQGETLVSRIYHLDRGYENLEIKLSKLGANVKRVK